MGGNPIDQNKFTFQLGAKGGYVPTAVPTRI